MSIVFTWPRGPAEVKVTGTFDAWSQNLSLIKQKDESFSIEVPLPSVQDERKIEFKFIVDGEWKVSEDYWTVVDSEGNVNNYIEISKKSGVQTKSIAKTPANTNGKTESVGKTQGNVGKTESVGKTEGNVGKTESVGKTEGIVGKTIIPESGLSIPVVAAAIDEPAAPAAPAETPVAKFEPAVVATSDDAAQPKHKKYVKRVAKSEAQSAKEPKEPKAEAEAEAQAPAPGPGPVPVAAAKEGVKQEVSTEKKKKKSLFSRLLKR